jgi:hypothetical protein
VLDRQSDTLLKVVPVLTRSSPTPSGIGSRRIEDRLLLMPSGVGLAHLGRPAAGQALRARPQLHSPAAASSRSSTGQFRQVRGGQNRHPIRRQRLRAVHPAWWSGRSRQARGDRGVQARRGDRRLPAHTAAIPARAACGRSCRSETASRAVRPGRRARRSPPLRGATARARRGARSGLAAWYRARFPASARQRRLPQRDLFDFFEAASTSWPTFPRSSTRTSSRRGRASSGRWPGSRASCRQPPCPTTIAHWSTRPAVTGISQGARRGGGAFGARDDVRVLMTTGAGDPEQYAHAPAVRAFAFLPGPAASRRGHRRPLQRRRQPPVPAPAGRGGGAQQQRAAHQR